MWVSLCNTKAVLETFHDRNIDSHKTEKKTKLIACNNLFHPVLAIKLDLFPRECVIRARN